MGERSLLEHRVLLELECYKVENGVGSEISMKGFAIKASISDCFTKRRGREESKDFLVKDCREEVLVTKDKIGYQ